LKGPDDVDGIYVLKVGRIDSVKILQFDEFRRPRVVHQRVAAPEMRLDAPRQLSALPILGDVGALDEHIGAMLPANFGDFLRRLGIFRVIHAHIPAALRK
jgi:hypothetical protein